MDSRGARRRTENLPRPLHVHLADAAQVLLSHVGGAPAVLAVASLVDDQRARSVRRTNRIFEHKLYPAPVHLFRIPPGLREKPLQTLGLLALRSYIRLGIGK